METLLSNIQVMLARRQKMMEVESEMSDEALSSLYGVYVSQGLLKVAVESARSRNKQNQLERKELKLELDRERDARQTLQRQLSSELQTRGGVRGRGVIRVMKQRTKDGRVCLYLEMKHVLCPRQRRSTGG